MNDTVITYAVRSITYHADTAIVLLQDTASENTITHIVHIGRKRGTEAYDAIRALLAQSYTIEST